MDFKRLYLNAMNEIDTYKNDLVIEKEEDAIKKFEDFFKTVNFFNRNVYKQPTKYYLQNKVKTELDGVQDSIRKEIEKKNKTYKERFYFIDIKKTVLNREENKHIYNVVSTSIIEYDKINVYSDFISTNTGTYHYYENPLTLVYLNNIDKLSLYDMIENSINSSGIYTEYDEENDFHYHNNYLDILNDVINKFILTKYSSKNIVIKRVLDILNDIDEHIKISKTINVKKTLIEHNSDKNEEKIDNIIRLLLSNGYDYNLKIIKSDYFD